MVGRDDRRSRGSALIALLVMALAYVAGTLVGKLAGVLVGAGALHDVFSHGFRIGTHDKPIFLDGGVVDLTLGFNFDLNLFGLLFMFVSLLLYKRT